MYLSGETCLGYLPLLGKGFGKQVVPNMQVITIFLKQLQLNKKFSLFPMVSARVRTPSKNVSTLMWVSPPWYHSKFVHPPSPKYFSLFDLPPRYHMKYLAHQLCTFSAHGYGVIGPVLFQDFLLDQTHIPRISFLILWNTRFHSWINI